MYIWWIIRVKLIWAKKIFFFKSYQQKYIWIPAEEKPQVTMEKNRKKTKNL